MEKLILIGILLAFGLWEALHGALKASKRKSSDWIQEVGGFVVLSVLINPGIVLFVQILGLALLPEFDSAFQAWPLYVSLPIYLFIDDLLQYTYHRAAHERPFLWKLHRAHHEAEEMGFFVSYRNAALYYVLMPNIWWMGICTFFGGAIAVAVGLVMKQLVIISSHSSMPWDRPLYRSNAGQKLIGFLERIIITPSFHHAHHGKAKLDGVSNPNANYGNMFSIWDQLFGSAEFKNDFPAQYGIQKANKDHWTAAYLYPLVQSPDAESELSLKFNREDHSLDEGIRVKLQAGDKYMWCRCGYSAQQPFCDGSHQGSPHQPLLFELKRDKEVKLCQCKKTRNPPYCDGSHEQ